MAKAAKKKVSPGRPTRKNKISPRDLEVIAEMHLQGYTNTEIGRRFNVDRKAIAQHLSTTIRPVWQEHLGWTAADELANIAMIQRVAWIGYHASQKGTTTTNEKTLVEKALKATKAKAKKDKNTAAISLLEKVEKHVTDAGRTDFLAVIQWCSSERSKLLGLYATPKAELEIKGSLRFAGKTTAEVDEEMMTRLMKGIADRRKYNAALESFGGN